MYEKIIRLRGWLERNKIFFDVIAVFFLTLMSITIAINANKIAEDQNDLIKEENQPIFVFDPTYANNDILDIGEGMNIYNIGKPAYNFKAESYVFFDINLYNKSDFSEKKAFVPIIGYYGSVDITGSPVDLLSSFNRDYFRLINGTNYTGNRAVFYHISEDFRDYSETQNCFGDIELKRYFHITYSDVYGETHDEIHYVDDLGVSDKLEEKEKIDLNQIYQDSCTPNRFDHEFRYFSPAEIIKILSYCSYDLESGEE